MQLLFSDMTVIAGTNTRITQTPGQQRRKVVKVQRHENARSDIALLKLDSPIRFSDTIRPVCLPENGEEAPVTKTCVTTGWGRNECNGHSLINFRGIIYQVFFIPCSHILQLAEWPKASFSSCPLYKRLPEILALTSQCALTLRWAPRWQLFYM